ncbi:enoyl-CoA hydratase-related protein [Caulobacter sp. KR2-114]|uniref:enoyl-CoA hydratase-related protein n=1 Tax=Caulobacter sp. KR2-114 TaxID=3400912 RepID=UPI003C04FDD9
MSEQFETILYEVEDPVAVITLNRPERLNAWNMVMAREVREAVRQAGQDKRVVGVVITGAGRAFCSGGDLKSITPDDLKERPADAAGPAAPQAAADPAGPLGFLIDLPKPVIAALNGHAFGMGAVIALWADMRFMAEEAIFSMAFSTRGTVAESGSSCLLTRLVGPSVALDLLISSRRIGAEEALRLGVVNAIAPASDLVEKARTYIKSLADTCSPASVATMKRQVYADLPDDLGAASAASRRLLGVAAAGSDIMEGWTAYQEKRAPRYARIGSD